MASLAPVFGFRGGGYGPGIGVGNGLLTQPFTAPSAPLIPQGLPGFGPRTGVPLFPQGIRPEAMLERAGELIQDLGDMLGRIIFPRDNNNKESGFPSQPLNGETGNTGERATDMSAVIEITMTDPAAIYQNKVGNQCVDGIQAWPGSSGVVQRTGVTGIEWELLGGGNGCGPSGSRPKLFYANGTSAVQGQWGLGYGASVRFLGPFTASMRRISGNTEPIPSRPGVVPKPSPPLPFFDPLPDYEPQVEPLAEPPPKRQQPFAPAIAPPVPVPGEPLVEPAPAAPPPPTPGRPPYAPPFVAPAKVPQTGGVARPGGSSQPYLPPSPSQIGPGGQVVAPPQVGPITTPADQIQIGVITVPGTGPAPQPTLEGIATELGRIERKIEFQLLRDQFQLPEQPPPDFSGLENAIQEILATLNDAYGSGSYQLVAPCQEGITATANWPAGAGQFDRLSAQVDALAELLQHHKDLRQPVCATKASGQPVTVQFQEIG